EVGPVTGNRVATVGTANRRNRAGFIDEDGWSRRRTPCREPDYDWSNAEDPPTLAPQGQPEQPDDDSQKRPQGSSSDLAPFPGRNRDPPADGDHNVDACIHQPERTRFEP